MTGNILHIKPEKSCASNKFFGRHYISYLFQTTQNRQAVKKIQRTSLALNKSCRRNRPQKNLVLCLSIIKDSNNTFPRNYSLASRVSIALRRRATPALDAAAYILKRKSVVQKKLPMAQSENKKRKSEKSRVMTP